MNFEGEDEIYVKEGFKDFHVVPLTSIHNGKIWLGGNTIAGKAEFFRANPYIDNAFGAADSSMQLNIDSSNTQCIALMDKFNVVAFRNADIRLHTWKDEAEKLKKNRQILSNKEEYFI